MAHKPDHSWLEENSDLTNLGPGSNTGPSNPPTGNPVFPVHPPVPPKTPEQIKAEAQARIASRMPPKRPIDVFGPHARIAQDAKRDIGVNYFLDINAHGFRVTTQHLSTDFKLNDFGDPVTPQQKYLDKKGDFVEKYTKTSNAGPIYKTPPSPVQKQLNKVIQDKGIPTDLFLDSKGDFVPVFNESRKSSTITNTVSSDNSRLWTLHENGITTREGKISLRTTNEGYTNYMPAVKLDDYYARLFKDNGILGIRNDGVSGNPFNENQPRIIREIGKTWGKDTFKLPEGSPAYAQKAVDTVNEIGERVLGRNPATYVDRYIADVNRLLPYANPLGTYALAQSFLQKKNPFKWPSTLQYALAGTPGLKGASIEGELRSIWSDAHTLIDPRGYNPLSIFSAPGVVHLGRNSTVLDPMTLIRKAPLAAVALAGVAGMIGAKALEMAAPKTFKVISDIVDIGIGAISNWAKGIPEKGLFGSIGAAVAGGVNFIKDSAKSIAAKSKMWQGIKKLDLTKKFPLNAPLLTGAATWGYNTLEAGIELIGVGAEYARDKAKIIGDTVGILGKAALQHIDLAAFTNMGVDHVNLIQKYEEHYEGKSFRQLDSIPFKFHDIRSDVPIVFRAILSGITDTFTPEYASERYVGRPDAVHVYQGTDREIAFTFDVYPKSDVELVTLWSKLNALAGLTYPHMTEPVAGGRSMVSPYTRLTIGDMYDGAPGFINSLTYTVMDEGTWETTFAKLPKYIQVNVTFTYIGDYVMESKQKLFDVDWDEATVYNTRFKSPIGEVLNMLKTGDMSFGRLESFKKLASGGVVGGTVKESLGKFANIKKESKNILGSLGI
jgi:hypothetical protein